MNALNQGLYNALANNSGLTTALGGTFIYDRVAPDLQSLPYVVFSWQGGGLTADHDIVNRLQFVRGYADSGYTAGLIASAIDTALNGNPLTVTGWTNIHLRREDDYESIEALPNGENVYTEGGIYRVILDK